MRLSITTSAALVFAAGLCYGAMAPIVKSAYQAGFTWQQTTAGQATFGMLLFGIVLVLQMLREKKLEPVSGTTFAKLLGTGASTCCTCVFYSISLSYLPAAVAITLLFQFTWLGIVVQVIVTRKPPHRAEVAAAAIVLAGTLFASGLFSSELAIDYHPVGVACGLVSAVSCTLFMFLSSRVANDMAPVQRGFIVCIGAAVLGNAVCPTFVFAGTIVDIAPFGITQGFFALLLPVVLFGLGTPRLPTGISTILASSELPCSITLTMIFLGERVDALQAAGVVIILAGVVVSQLPALAHMRGLRKRLQAEERERIR